MELSRRRFLEGCAATLGVALVGCAPDAGASAPQTRANADGSIALSGAAKVAPGAALAFSFPDGEPGLYFVTKDGKRGAVSAKCTHLGCLVQWNAPDDASAPLRCPCHESHFALDGAVLSGPAKAPLTRYAATPRGDETILQRL